MTGRAGFTVRLLAPALILLAAGLWFGDVQQGGPWLLWNLAPLAVLFLLCGYVLHRGGGRWSGAGAQWPLAVLGFAIPALGLSAYLHYAYAVNLNGLFTDARYPWRVFRYLPLYTFGAGAIGFAIGWIVGRNVR